MIELIKRLVKGEPLTAAEHDGNMTAIEDEFNRETSFFFAGIVDNENGVAITDTGEFVRLPSPWVSPQNRARGFELQGEDIVCTDPVPRLYRITAPCYVDDGSNVTALVSLAKNGDRCQLCAARVTIPSAERPAGETTQTVFELVAGDVVTLVGTRIKSTGALVLEDASILITEV